MADRDFAAGIAADELTDDIPLGGKVGDEDVVIVRHAGRLCAVSGICPHLGAPLADGLVVNGELRCPWHHARFDLTTGEATGAPAFAPLDRYEVVEEDGHIRVGDRQEVKPRPHEAPDLGRVLIVGGGAAGHACAEMLARNGAGGSVTLLSKEVDAPYDRTACSKAYLAGDKDRDAIALPSPGDDVDWRDGSAVIRLLPAEQAVEIEGGERIGYDTLILATGAEPTVPSFDGANRDTVHTVRTLADADRLIAATQGAKRALVLGSSYIGLEVTASLIARGLRVDVAAPDDVPLEKTAGDEVASMIRSLHESKGVRFHLGREIAAWNGEQATLDDGTTIAADFVIAGTGVSPCVTLAEDAGLKMAADDAGGGVSVDGQLRTSDHRIYAIGDIANAPDARLGHPIRVEHWVVAQRMGQWLARHLLGQVDGEYGDTPFFWSGHYDINLRYVGHVDDPRDRTIDGDVAAQDFAVTFRENGKDQALLTCGRDQAALAAEARWDR